MIESLRRIVRFGFQNYWRKGWLSLAATLVVALTLFIISVFTLQVVVIRSTIKSIENRLDISIYLDDDLSQESTDQFIAQIKSMSQVKEVEFLDKAAVLTEWQKLNLDSRIKEKVTQDDNPLPRTIKIKTNDPTQLEGLVAEINRTKFVGSIHDISYRNNRPVIEQLISQSQKTMRNGVTLGVIFFIISIAFVYNTFRIVIQFRQDEIAVMRLVGATHSFILGPYLVEGTLYGLLGGGAACIAIYFFVQNGLTEGVSALGTPSDVISTELANLFIRLRVWLFSGVVVSAVIISLLCSWFSVRRYINTSG